MSDQICSVSNRNWTLFKTRIKDQWRELNDQELEKCRGRYSALKDVIEGRSRESRLGVINFIDNLWFEIYVRGSRRRFPQM